MKSLFASYIWADSKKRKTFIIGLLSLIVLVIAYSIAMRILDARAYKEKVVILPTWKSSKSNFVYLTTKKEEKAIGGQSTNLAKKYMPPEGFYYAKYRFRIKQDGVYNIFWAGSPPGPVEEGSEWFSPFWVRFDEGDLEHFTQERTEEDYPYHPTTEYVPGAYYITKLTSKEFTAGDHTMEIRVDEPRKIDDMYFLIADVVFFVKKGYKPSSKHFKKFQRKYFI